jgi:hypothetical protein
VNDPYGSPEQFGLTTIAELERSDGNYQFDLLVLWRRTSDGAVVWAEDSGCSCPSPFEDTGVEDLQVLNSHTWPEFERAARAVDPTTEPKTVADFLDKAREALR